MKKKNGDPPLNLEKIECVCRDCKDWVRAHTALTLYGAHGDYATIFTNIVWRDRMDVPS
jgi:hypothetical protein